MITLVGETLSGEIIRRVKFSSLFKKFVTFAWQSFTRQSFAWIGILYSEFDAFAALSMTTIPYINATDGRRAIQIRKVYQKITV